MQPNSLESLIQPISKGLHTVSPLKPISVELTWYELSLASQVGGKRNIESLSKKMKDKHGFKDDAGWNVHIEGAAAELAFAKATNMYWSGSVNTFKRGGDVGSIQVRSTKTGLSLIVRDEDKDTDIFVLVTGSAPKFEVIGWLSGKDAKNPTYSKTYNGRPAAFFVPQSALKSIETLPR